jgi:hypothetical protein
LKAFNSPRIFSLIKIDSKGIEDYQFLCARSGCPRDFSKEDPMHHACFFLLELEAARSRAMRWFPGRESMNRCVCSEVPPLGSAQCVPDELKLGDTVLPKEQGRVLRGSIDEFYCHQSDNDLLFIGAALFNQGSFYSCLSTVICFVCLLHKGFHF